MGKITLVPLNAEARRFEKANKVLEKYLNIADRNELREMSSDILWLETPLNTRKKAFATHKKTISALRPLFKQYVIELNKVAKKDGYKNRIEFINQYHKISKEKYELFLEKADDVTKILNQKFPEPPAEWADWYWSKYNTPDALRLATKKEYVVPDDIIKMIKKKTPKVAALLPKIEIETRKGFLSSALYDKKRKKVIISTPLQKTDLRGALVFIHEISHAVVDFDCVEKGIDPLSKSKYWGEKETHRVASSLIKKLFSKKIHEAWLASFLDGFSRAFFEYEIYNHSERNFDRAFARANNRCYLKANQYENPFYVIKSYLVSRAGHSAMASVAITELLLEGKI